MIDIVPDMDSLSLNAADLFVTKARESLAKGRFSVALSGGSTPCDTYRLLAQSPFMDQVPWHIVHFFWGDERWVPPSDPQSNEGKARKALLDHIPVAEDQIHPVYQSGMNAEEAATEYDRFLRRFFTGEPHLFDLIFLGLGENGHTASLFPHTTVLQRTNRWVEEVFPAGQDLFRITLTADVINHSALIVFLVSGSNKADILQKVLEGPDNPEEYPAQLIRPENGELLWIVDEVAAQNLSGTRRRTHGAMR
jgi:6-phosphogluconolactonase